MQFNKTVMKSMSSGGGGGRKHVQVFASVAANLCQHAVGHCVPMSSYILPQLVNNNQDQLSLSDAQGSWFGKNNDTIFQQYLYTIRKCIAASLYVVGCLTGSLVGGYQCDYLGRKKSMLLDSAMMIVGFLSMGLAPNVELLLFGIQ